MVVSRHVGRVQAPNAHDVHLTLPVPPPPPVRTASGATAVTTGADVAVGTVGAIALIYFRRGVFNNAAGVRAAAAAGTCDTEPYPVPTATFYTSVEPVAAGDTVALLY